MDQGIQGTVTMNLQSKILKAIGWGSQFEITDHLVAGCEESEHRIGGRKWLSFGTAPTAFLTKATSCVCQSPIGPSGDAIYPLVE